MKIIHSNKKAKRLLRKLGFHKLERPPAGGLTCEILYRGPDWVLAVRSWDPSAARTQHLVVHASTNDRPLPEILEVFETAMKKLSEIGTARGLRAVIPPGLN